MRPTLLASSFVAASLFLSGAAVTYVACPGCIDRSRVNKRCDWTGDTAFSIDPRNESHRQHLVADAQLAEELAIRHGDAEFGRRFGVEHHGGLIDNGRFRRECLSRMFGAITAHHDVTSEQIDAARGERNGAFDLAVGLLFLPIYSLCAVVACRRLLRRFSDDDRAVRGTATILSSVAFSVLGVQSFRLYGALWESIRVGNGHMTGMRAASLTRWSQHYVGAEFIGAGLLFLCIAWYCYRSSDDRYETPELKLSVQERRSAVDVFILWVARISMVITFLFIV